MKALALDRRVLRLTIRKRQEPRSKRQRHGMRGCIGNPHRILRAALIRSRPRGGLNPLIRHRQSVANRPLSKLRKASVPLQQGALSNRRKRNAPTVCKEPSKRNNNNIAWNTLVRWNNRIGPCRPSLFSISPSQNRRRIRS